MVIYSCCSMWIIGIWEEWVGRHRIGIIGLQEGIVSEDSKLVFDFLLSEVKNVEGEVICDDCK